MKKFVIFCFAGFLLVLSCRKAGTGGKNTLVILPEHHGKLIPGCSTYIAFGTREKPSTDLSLYDLHIPGTPGVDTIRVESLRPGDYYIFCTGFDSAINDAVEAGIPLEIRKKSGETQVIVPVTEGD